MRIYIPFLDSCQESVRNFIRVYKVIIFASHQFAFTVPSTAKKMKS